MECGATFRTLLMRVLPCMDNEALLARTPPSPRSGTTRAVSKRIRGHRFSKEIDEREEVEKRAWMEAASPLRVATPMRTFDHFCLEPPPADAPRVLLLDPGSGEACGALLQLQQYHVALAAGPEYDQPVKRYPPHWKSMAGVKLTEAEAAADSHEAAALRKRMQCTASWPSFSDLRGSAHPLNLATWASTIFEADRETFRAVEITSIGCDRTAARHLAPTAGPVSAYSCLICGSRAGEVTLPALWLLGCRLPAVVINGGCAREAATWLWPPDVPVVLLTGSCVCARHAMHARHRQGTCTCTGTGTGKAHAHAQAQAQARHMHMHHAHAHAPCTCTMHHAHARHRQGIRHVPHVACASGAGVACTCAHPRARSLIVRGSSSRLHMHMHHAPCTCTMHHAHAPCTMHMHGSSSRLHVCTFRRQGPDL